MPTEDSLRAQIEALRGKLSELLYENGQLKQRRSLQHDFGFMAPYPGSPGNPTPSDIQYGFMEANKGGPVESQPGFGITRKDKNFGFMAAEPHVIHKPPYVLSEGYGLGAKSNMNFGFMRIPEAEIITEYGKPSQLKRYGFMTTSYITKRFFW